MTEKEVDNMLDQWRASLDTFPDALTGLVKTAVMPYIEDTAKVRAFILSVIAFTVVGLDTIATGVQHTASMLDDPHDKDLFTNKMN